MLVVTYLTIAKVAEADLKPVHPMNWAAVFVVIRLAAKNILLSFHETGPLARDIRCGPVGSYGRETFFDCDLFSACVLLFDMWAACEFKIDALFAYQSAMNCKSSLIGIKPPQCYPLPQAVNLTQKWVVGGVS